MSNKRTTDLSDFLESPMDDDILKDIPYVFYFNLKWALKQHDTVLKESGGLPGILNKGQLESILNAMKNDEYYPSFTEKITHLVFSICKYHVFVDANKRTAIALGAYFLNLNGYEYCIHQFISDMEHLVVMLVDHKLTEVPGYLDKDEKDVLGEFIACIIFSDSEYPPDLDDLLTQYKNQNHNHP